MTATRFTIELTPAEVKRLDAYVARGAEQRVGRAMSRHDAIRRIIREELNLVDRLPEGYWAKVGGSSSKTEGPNG